MGNWINKALAGLLNLNQQAKILMLGLDAAGKTTILFKMKLGEQINTQPTIGFNVEQVNYKNLEFTIWDVGGQEILRKLWHHYYTGTDALIFVVDSADPTRLQEAAKELQFLLRADELRDAVVLVFANKQDLPDAVPVSGVVSALGLHAMKTRKWHVQAACARTGDGLADGFDWLSTTVCAK